MINRVIESIVSQFQIVLGSSSERRYEILQQVMGVPQITIMKPSFEEDLNKSEFSNPVNYVIETSRHKALGIVNDLKDNKTTSAVASPPKLIVCADTVVIDSQGNIHEKPQYKEIQLKNLKKFCYELNEPLKVVTAVTVVRWNHSGDYEIRDTFTEETKLYMDSQTPLDLLEDYVASGEGTQVAGGFKIQGASAVFIKKIDGDYYNVVGLPLNKTFQALYRELQNTGTSAI
ncbi:hypothetical protein ZYGR_0H02500 [Zygosaccharomyces rouxii]|uniref:ZYRO0B09768p n=2 Tax=Zygosaccharomyces rouxii TaxID=4956 RepID=C5DRN0_ZYGRC|nr:uncharacterized protein ZYRO0B09768g [Zygosaccharomyces rouxii]KAH9200025.1 Maf-like protein [Zygosaccharomyces rouxii]GAV47408.1 hypothetical protein ZYGR_0H02500 [Zygosaccharomyces rouxii]CAR26441.1 ZYRO0B09768p [Zygosaccharomyces rouxii]